MNGKLLIRMDFPASEHPSRRKTENHYCVYQLALIL